MQLSIPLLQTSSGGSGGGVSYNTAVDASYEIYNINLGLFNVPNAFTDGADTSQGKRGILGVGPRHSQNQAWNSQYGVYIAAGASALSVKALTYDFNRSIKSIDSGNIIGGLYFNPGGSFFPFDQTNNGIGVVQDSTASITNTKRKGFVVTSGGNNYLIVATGNSIVSYACNTNGVPSGSEISTQALPTYHWGTTAFIIGSNGSNIFCVNMGYTNGPYWRYSLYGHILSVSSAGVLSIVNSTQVYDPPALSLGMIQDYTHFRIASDQVGSTIYVYSFYTTGQSSIGPARHRRDLFSVDSTNISIFTFTNIRNDTPGTIMPNGTIIAEVAGGRHTANNEFLYVRETSVDIYEIDASGDVDSGQNYFGVGDLDLCLKRNNLTKLTTATDNAYITETARQLRVDNVLANGTLTGINHIRIIKHSGVGSEEDNVTGLYVNCLALGVMQSAEQIQVKEDGTTIATQTILAPNSLSNTYVSNFNISLPLTTYVANKTQLLLEITFTNPVSRLSKLGFGLTGGTYSSPTGTNGTFGGDATNGSTLTGTPSLLSLTIQ